MKSLTKNLAIIIAIFLLVSLLFTLVDSSFEEKEEVPFSTLVRQIEEGEVEKITVSGNDVSILYNDETEAQSRKETESSLLEQLVSYGVSAENLRSLEIETKRETGAWLWPLFITLFPFLLFVLIILFMFRRARSGVTQTFNFTKAKARLFGAEGHSKERISFKDVAGLKEAKEELKEVVDFLKFPKKYLKMGARIPRGALLLGGAGVGKTMLARAVAGEAGVPFFHISGSEFVEMFVGVGASRVRDLFSTAKKASPSIIFVDELDAIGRQRGTGLGGGHDEKEQTLNQILVEMDGFERETNVIVMAATNRGDVLDPALLRPGRFDRKIILDPPDVHDREELLNIHAKEKPLAMDVNFKEVAERTPGFSGAEVANVVNEAAILAARKNKSQINQEEFLESIEKVLLGPERKSHILTKKEKEIAAYHEAGHALVSTLLSDAEPVRKISIISRGMAAGYTIQLPKEEKRLKTKKEFLAEMATFLGGYCAERIIFNETTTGASSDLKGVSALARKLVKEYGMSALGPVSFGDGGDPIFLGKEMSEQRNYSEKIAALIDNEVEKFVKSAEKEAFDVLKKNEKTLERIAKTLIKKETIEREEYEKLIESSKKKPKKSSKKA